MTQLSRLISILTLLKSKRVLTSTELSNKFDVSIRTVYRDIQKLIEAGVPVITIEGKGYTLTDGYTVAPIQFTEKEANALITAQHLVSKSNDSSFITDFEEALTKIKSVFRYSILEKSEMLNKKIHVFDKRVENISSNALSEIQLATTNFNYIEINYRKIDNSTPTFRKVEPYMLLYSENKWILMAWCYLRKDYRAFRIDRILHFRILSEKFEDRKFDPKAYYRVNLYEHKKDKS